MIDLLIENATVVEQREPVPHAGDARHSPDAGRVELARLHANERSAVREQLGAPPSTDRRADRQQPVEDDAKDQSGEAKSRRQSIDSEWHVPRISARQPRRMFARHLDRDLGA